MDEAFTLAALIAVSMQVTDLLRFLSAGQLRQALTGVIPWVALFVVLLLGSQADVTNQLPIPGTGEALGGLNWASLLLVAIAGGSTGSQVVNFKQAIDGTDSSRVPPLGGPPAA